MALYRKSRPYRKPQTYRGAVDTGAAVLPPTHYGGVGVGWDSSRANDTEMTSRWTVGTAADMSVSTPYGDLVGQHDQPLMFPVRQHATHGAESGMPWTELSAHQVLTTAPISQHDAFAAEASAHWADFEGRHTRPYASRWRQATPHDRPSTMRWRELASHGLACSALWRSIVARGGLVALPWGPIGARSNGINITWPVEPDPPPGVITIPSLPVYVMLPTLSCVRLPDRTPIRILGATLQAELGSFAWTFSAPIALADTLLLNAPGGAPTEIEITINGYVWTFIVEGYDDNRRFGSRTATMRGASRSKLLAEPYAAPRTFIQAADRDASQLATDELPVGWTLVWDAVDFLVPGGTFSYQDLAPIDAIAQVANAIGAAVLSDPADLSLSVVPTYADSPWAWDSATPYAIIPASILTAGDSTWQGGVNADGVYVYAQDSASGAFVKITGTAGDTQLPMIVDRLTVSADPQRERGRIALAGAGIKRTINRTIPLFPTPAPAGQPDFGPVMPGKLLELEDGFLEETWRGQVMGVRIDAQRGGSALSVRQTLTIERQFR